MLDPLSGVPDAIRFHLGMFVPAEERAMWKPITFTGAALALSAACILSPLRVKEAVAQSALPYINSGRH